MGPVGDFFRTYEGFQVSKDGFDIIGGENLGRNLIDLFVRQDLLNLLINVGNLRGQ
jgi:hypothetical protein